MEMGQPVTEVAKRTAEKYILEHLSKQIVLRACFPFAIFQQFILEVCYTQE